MSQHTELPHLVEEWTREQVHSWLTEVIKVEKKHADSLYEEEVSGKELICFQPKHLQGFGIKLGPAVRIITKFNELKQPNEDDSEHSVPVVMQDTTVEMKEKVSTNQTPTSLKKSKGKAQKQGKYRQANALERPTNLNQDKQASVDNITQPKYSQTKEPSQLGPFQKCLAEPLRCESFNGIEQKMPADPKALAVDEEKNRTPLRNSCSLHPFDQNFASHRYIENYTLPPETGPGNLIDPVHEYKFMGRTDSIHIMKKKFNKEVFRFAAGCMNSRTNGTIHFGVADSKNSEYAHGEIIGIHVEEKDIIIDHFNHGIKSYFENDTGNAKACIRQPRFVEVLCPDSTLSGKYVIEVDVVPSHSVVQGKLFEVQTLDEDNQWKKSKGKSLFIRDGAATRDIYKIANPKELLCERDKINTQLDNKRNEAEKRPKSKKNSNQGEKLKNLLTCGGNVLGHYNYYIIVTNKSHQEQLQHLQFMTTLKLFCVLDFDPNSAVSGSCHNYREVRIANVHKPIYFSGDPGTVANTLNLYKQTSWVFCNGREDLKTESDRPLRPSEWLTSKAGEVQDMISFLCNPKTLPRGRFLVIFLLLSTVETMNDPIFDTFMSFYKKLGDTKDILSICTTNASFQKWRDLIQTRCECDISLRSIYDLELSEINGTVLKLGQNKSNAQRLLPSAEGSSVVLHQKDKDIMTSLEVLCENECENIFDESSAEFEDFKIKTETEFYRGKVTWWNFYFSELPGANPFIKRDKQSSLENTIRSQTKDSSKTCVIVNLFHQPGCGGTTMAMHVMWNLRKEFRCAVLKHNTVSTEVSKHVSHLMQCGKNEQSFKMPVLLLVEDSEETENTQELQHSLRKITGETGTFIIILNCIRTNLPEVRYKESVIESVFIEAALSDNEKYAFEKKHKEIKSFTTENFYSFMIMKSNFDPEYVANIATKILKDFKVESKREQLFCILALLNSYEAEPAIPSILCENFLGIKSALWGREPVLEKMEPYSCLLMEFEAEEYGGLKAVSFVHQHLATECVKQLEETRNCSRADIVLNILHHCNLFFKTFTGTSVLLQLLKSLQITQHEKPSILSSLIKDITEKDGPNKTQEVCKAAQQVFEKNFCFFNSELIKVLLTK